MKKVIISIFIVTLLLVIFPGSIAYAINNPPVAVAVDQTVEATSVSGAYATLDGTGSYDPDGDVIEYSWAYYSGPAVITFDDSTSPTPTALFPLGSTIIRLTVTDPYGGADVIDVMINVVDTTPPQLHVPGDIITEAENSSGAEVSFLVWAVDPVGLDLLTVDPWPGTVFPLGETIVECTATDLAGNTAEASFKVTVVDTTAPKVSIQHPMNAGGNPLPFNIVGGEDEVTSPENMMIFIRDRGSGTVFGPFNSGDCINYNVDPNTIPKMKAMKKGQFDYLIIGQGPGEVFAVDEAGNTSDPIDL